MATGSSGQPKVTTLFNSETATAKTFKKIIDPDMKEQISKSDSKN